MTPPSPFYLRRFVTMIDYKGIFTILIALILYSLIEHMVIAPRMKHSPPNVVETPTLKPRTPAELVSQVFPDAVTV